MRRLFIHIPKCGGMSVRRGAADKIILASRENLPDDYAVRCKRQMDKHGEHHGFEHARWRDVRPEVRDYHAAFAIVRNPWARVVSRYTFAQHIGDRAGSVSFRDFLEQRHEYGSLKYFWHRGVRGWYPQRDHVVDEYGVQRVTCLRLGTGDVERYLACSGNLRKRNVSNVEGLDYRDFYGRKTRQLVADWYAEDIDHFGFDFDGHATRNVWTPS